MKYNMREREVGVICVGPMTDSVDENDLELDESPDKAAAEVWKDAFSRFVPGDKEIRVVIIVGKEADAEELMVYAEKNFKFKSPTCINMGDPFCHRAFHIKNVSAPIRIYWPLNGASKDYVATKMKIIRWQHNMDDMCDIKHMYPKFCENPLVAPFWAQIEAVVKGDGVDNQ